MEQKGKNEYATSFLAGFVRGLGYKRCIFASDNEPALLALLADVSAALPEVEVVPRPSIEGDHQANGLAEVGVREVKAQSRVLRSHVEYCYKRRLSRDEPLFAWMVRHAANVINRGRIGTDGKTPEQRRTGKQWRRPSLWFGEQCFFKRAQTKAIQGADERMTKGVYIGHHERTGATLLLTPEGVRRGVGIVQLPSDQKFDPAFLATCKGLPWVPNPKRAQTSRQHCRRGPCNCATATSGAPRRSKSSAPTLRDHR